MQNSARRLLTAAWLVSTLTAQTTTIVPTIASSLPGNAGVAMPLRWSQGIVQVFVGSSMLPAALTGQTLTGLRLRRSSLLGDAADPAISRTLTIRGGFSPFAPAQIVGGVTANRPANTQILFGPASVTTTALATPSPAAAVGPDLLRVVFTTPLVVQSGQTLFLEFEVGNAPMTLSSSHWVDAVWMNGGTDNGYAVTVGTGACTTRSTPTQLQWTGSGPTAGSTATMQLTGAPASGLAMAWVSIDPQSTNFGLSLAAIDPGLVGCYQWAQTTVSWFGVTDAAGTFATSFAVPSNAALGARLGVQAAWYDASRSGVPVSLSNGLVLVVGTAGVGSNCGSLYFPGTLQNSPWPIFLGQMPVLLLEH